MAAFSEHLFELPAVEFANSSATEKNRAVQAANHGWGEIEDLQQILGGQALFRD